MNELAKAFKKDLDEVRADLTNRLGILKKLSLNLIMENQELIAENIELRNKLSKGSKS